MIGTLDAGLYGRSMEMEDLQKLPLPITKPIRSIISYTPDKIAVGVDLEGVFVIDKANLTIDKQYAYNETSSTLSS